MALRATLSRGAERIAPKLTTSYRVRRILRETPEPEMHLLALLCSRDKLAIDVGSAGGAYTFRLARLASRCIAFDPQTRQAQRLARTCRILGLPVDVIEAALSEADGIADLRVVSSNIGRSTVETLNSLQGTVNEDIAIFKVPMKTLDSFDLSPVGFIKIDVEGHELKVLMGATSTLTRERPNLLIETEDRHNPGVVGRVFSFLDDLGYKGFFIEKNTIKPIEDFSLAVHQAPFHAKTLAIGDHKTESYINNFLFVPVGRRLTVVEGAASLLRLQPAL